MRGVQTAPGYVIRPRISILYNLRDWRPPRDTLGTFLVVTRYRNRCLIASPKFLCVIEVSLRTEHTNCSQCAASFITTAHYVSYLNILLSTSYNKSTNSTFQELWLDSWISIFKCPSRTDTSFPSVTSRSVNAGVPDFDHHTRDTTAYVYTAPYTDGNCIMRNDVHILTVSGHRRWPAAVWLPWSRVRIPLKAWMCVSSVCGVLYR